MGEKEVGKIPVNARISIDYTGEKPKVEFDYPRKDVIKQNLHGVIVLISLVIVISLVALLVKYPSILLGPGEDINFPLDCIGLKGYENHTIRNMTLVCDGEPYLLKFDEGTKYDNSIKNYILYLFNRNPRFHQTNPAYINLTNLFLTAIGILLFYGLAILLAILLSIILTKIAAKTEFGRAKIPEWNKKLAGRGYQAVFDTVPLSNVIEIPMFNNFYMDYHATEEFSKYLTKFEIKEHPFSVVMKKKGKVKKKKPQVTLWYARFYFSQQPKTGKLEVFFK